MISVEHDSDSIVVGKLCIANQFTRVDMRSVRVEGADAEINVPIIKQHPHFCPLRSRRTFSRLLLDKISRRLG